MTKVNLGITQPQVAAMLKQLCSLEIKNDAIAHTPTRHAISAYIVAIRKLLKGFKEQV
jgi:hypothetical protein